jgi:hypothetical protein
LLSVNMSTTGLCRESFPATASAVTVGGLSL